MKEDTPGKTQPADTTGMFVLAAGSDNLLLFNC